MPDRIERFRTPLLFLTGLLLAALVWGLMERAHDAAQPLELIPIDAPPGGLKVEVRGAVNIPGVYQFEPGGRIADAINAAGGPAVETSLSSLDMTTRLRDEQRIVVPTREEAARRHDGNDGGRGRADRPEQRGCGAAGDAAGHRPSAGARHRVFASQRWPLRVGR